MELSLKYKNRVADAMLEQRKNYGGTDTAFANTLGVNKSVFNRIKKGERDKLLTNERWIMIGRQLGVTLHRQALKTVATDVFEVIREEVLFCKEYSKSRMFNDNAGIGKTVAAKYLAKSEKNIFYIDGTQCKKKNAFIKALARVVGVPVKGRYDEMKDTTKYFLQILEKPLVIIDEWGALDKDALGLIQEYWNATDGLCGWYLIGGNAARNRMDNGILHDRDYFPELFSRMSEKYSSAVPKEINKKKEFYKKLVADVMVANMQDTSKLDELVNKCLITDANGNISGLRRAESLLLLYNA